MTMWPVQRDCDKFYGDPRIDNAAWQAANLVEIVPPWKVTFEVVDKETKKKSLLPVDTIRVHRKVAASFSRVLAAIWRRLGQSQAEIDRIGMSKFSGSYNLRTIAGSNALSMHAYGCAVDFDSANNWLGDTTPAMDRRVIEEFEREGWEWGGHWSRPDGMHFQAAWTRSSPPRLGPLTVSRPATPKQLATVSRKVSLLTRLRNWFMSFGAATGTVGASVFSLDNLGIVQGWSGVISPLGIAAAVIVVGAVGFWFFTNVLLKMIVEDHEKGRWTPSGASQPEPETKDGVA